MTITAEQINKLRKTTGAGMMDCKKALAEADGDFNAAIDNLRKRGQKISAKRADKEATEGVVITKTSGDNQTGIAVLLSCETDFVSKNEDFIQFAQKIADLALEKEPSNLEELISLEIDSNKVTDLILDQISKIGEKIELSEYRILRGENITDYIHLGNKIGVLVAFNKVVSLAMQDAGRDVAMQVAAMNPLAVDKDGIPQDMIDRELAIAKEQIQKEDKPQELAEKIAQGKLGKFFKENTLMNQEFVKDSSKSIKQYLQETDKELTVVDFVRVAIG